MFDDPRKELRRLEEQLLAEEAPQPPAPEEDVWLDDELEEARRLLGDELSGDEEDDPPVYRNYANGYGSHPPVRNYANGYGQPGRVRNRDRFDRDLEEYSDQVHDEPREKGVRGLVILACLELLGIAAVIVYWLLFLL